MKSSLSAQASSLVSLTVLWQSEIPKAVQACSFMVSNFDATKLESGRTLHEANYYSAFRGHDATNVQNLHGWTFLHNLLSMTGEHTLQPFVSTDKMVATVFNGEIYNCRNISKDLEGNPDAYNSDGLALLPAYQRWGDRFVEHLHGEFALVLVDFNRDVIVLSPDVFATKPLWYATWPCNHDVPNGKEAEETKNTCFVAASYKSMLTGLGVPDELHTKTDANKALILSTKQHFAKMDQLTLFEFDLNQHKTSTKDWEKAFVDAVRIRTDHVKHSIFMGLSSGYDSGAIMLALELLGLAYYAYYLSNRRDDDNVVWERIQYSKHANTSILRLSKQTMGAQLNWLSKRCEPSKTIAGKTFKGSRYHSVIFSKVRNLGGLIFLSGIGVDEIMTDYYRDDEEISGIGSMRCGRGGTFPSNLSDFFPYCSFYNHSMEHHILSVDTTTGAHGIEGRFPFIDPNVVQEFLWLTADVKKSEYKRPVADFLRRHNFPNFWAGKAPFASTQNFLWDSETIIGPGADYSRIQMVVEDSWFVIPKISFSYSVVITFGILCAVLMQARYSSLRRRCGGVGARKQM